MTKTKTIKDRLSTKKKGRLPRCEKCSRPVCKPFARFCPDHEHDMVEAMRESGYLIDPEEFYSYTQKKEFAKLCEKELKEARIGE